MFVTLLLLTTSVSRTNEQHKQKKRVSKQNTLFWPYLACPSLPTPREPFRSPISTCPSACVMHLHSWYFVAVPLYICTILAEHYRTLMCCYIYSPRITHVLTLSMSPLRAQSLSCVTHISLTLLRSLILKSCRHMCLFLCIHQFPPTLPPIYSTPLSFIHSTETLNNLTHLLHPTIFHYSHCFSITLQSAMHL